MVRIPYTEGKPEIQMNPEFLAGSTAYGRPLNESGVGLFGVSLVFQRDRLYAPNSPVIRNIHCIM